MTRLIAAAVVAFSCSLAHADRAGAIAALNSAESQYNTVASQVSPSSPQFALTYLKLARQHLDWAWARLSIFDNAGSSQSWYDQLYRDGVFPSPATGAANCIRSADRYLP